MDLPLAKLPRLWRATVAGLLLAAAAWPAGGVSAAWAGDKQEAEAPACGRCDLQVQFVEKLVGLAAVAEQVEIRNGIAIFYTTEQAENLSSLQASVERTYATLARIHKHPERAHLCSYCKAAWPVLSKLDREVLHTSSGAVVLITSSDPEAIRSLKDLVRNRSQQQARERRDSRR